MSGRSTRVRKGAKKTGYPALRAFCRGYLHQDVLDEHGSATAAIAAFRAESSAAEQRALEADWRRFATDTAGWPLQRVADFFADTLGAAWRPGGADDLTAFAAAITQPSPLR
jgi:hypothetical protein